MVFFCFIKIISVTLSSFRYYVSKTAKTNGMKNNLYE